MAEDERTQIILDMREMRLSLPDSAKKPVDLTGICSAKIGIDSRHGNSGIDFLEIQYYPYIVTDSKLSEYTTNIIALLEGTNDVVECRENRACSDVPPRHVLRYHFNSYEVTIKD